MSGMPTTPKQSKRWTTDSINFLTQDEMRSRLDAIDPKRDYAIFLLAYRHGLRASEVGMLHTGDLNLKDYRLRINRLKKSLADVHPLQPDEVKAVKAYLRERTSTHAPALFLSRNHTPISRRRLDELMKHYTAVCACIHKVLRVRIDDHDRRGDGHETLLPGSPPPDCPRL
jgi:integrase